MESESNTFWAFRNEEKKTITPRIAGNDFNETTLVIIKNKITKNYVVTVKQQEIKSPYFSI